MDTIGTFKETLKKSFLSSTQNSTGFYSPMKTGVSDFLESKRAKGYEFAEKPNYVNPFHTLNSNNGSLERDSAASPTKKNSIVRRHTDNYGTQSTVADNFKTYLTPCRWRETGWKYSKQGSDYFEHENKHKNTLGLSYHKLDDFRQHQTDYKTQYKRTFKDRPASNFNEGKLWDLCLIRVTYPCLTIVKM